MKKTAEKWVIQGRDGELFNGVLEPTRGQAEGAARDFFVHWDDLEKDGAKATRVFVTYETAD